jgi:hypothetical protein
VVELVISLSFHDWINIFRVLSKGLANVSMKDKIQGSTRSKWGFQRTQENGLYSNTLMALDSQQSSRAAITQYHRLGVINTETSHFWGLGNVGFF